MDIENELHLPFKDEWVVLWGGDTEDINAHHNSPAQKYAFDFLQKDSEGSSYTGDGKKNSDYYAFGQDVLVPADGVVVEASDGVRDNNPMETNSYSLTGNHVIIQHALGKYSLLAHLQCGSLSVSEGMEVKTGQKIGECGNSGNSSEPHIHYHLQTSNVFARFNPDGTTIDIAKGLKASFKNILIEREGNKKLINNYSPIKGDRISNVSNGN